jgi:hypothetical protein
VRFEIAGEGRERLDLSCHVDYGLGPGGGGGVGAGEGSRGVGWGGGGHFGEEGGGCEEADYSGWGVLGFCFIVPR